MYLTVELWSLPDTDTEPVPFMNLIDDEELSFFISTATKVPADS